jgi:hypothetical protein
MPAGSSEKTNSWSGDVSKAIQLLEEALAIVDRHCQPHLGARLQEVIESLKEERTPRP